MNIIVEGPEKAGKTTLIDLVLKGFKPEQSKKIHIHQPERDEPGGIGDGFGYLYRFSSNLDSPKITVWDRGWLSENVYGNLLDDDRHLAKDPFKTEWFYGRAMEGRGGKFVLLPSNVEQLEQRRDATDYPVNPGAEYSAFKRYGDYWGYNILHNAYDSKSLIDNMLQVRRSAYVGIHKSKSSQYIGSRTPSLTFVGDTTPEFGFAPKPFYCQNSMEYFRPFGRTATRNFGYATIEAVDDLIDKEPQLFKTVITVGPRAFNVFPEYPNVSYNEKRSEPNDVLVFLEGVVWALSEYRQNGRLGRGIRWPKAEHIPLGRFELPDPSEQNIYQTIEWIGKGN